MLGVAITQPPDTMTGMITMVLDGAGRLLSFSAVPPLLESGGTAVSPPDWAPLLTAAGLDEKALTPAAPNWSPMTRFDSRAAWDGVFGSEAVHVGAAAYRNFQAALAQGLYCAAYVYLAYLALEPYVRRRWPGMLISWTRALAG